MKNGFWKVFFYEFKILAGSPKKLFLSLGLPLILFFFFGLLFKAGTPNSFKVALIDYDKTSTSRKIIRALESTPEIEFSIALNNEDEAKKLLRRGDVYALVVIPQGVQKNVLDGQQSEIICYTNGQFLLPAGNIQKAFSTTIAMISAGIDIEKRKKKGQEGYWAHADVQPIKLDLHNMYNPYSNYGYYLITPFLPFMLEMLVVILSIYIIATPLKYGFADSWLRMSGGNSWSALWGKLLPYTIVFCFVGWFMNFYLFRIIGTPLQVPMWNVVLLTFVLILTHQLLAVFFVNISKDMRSALTFGGGFCAVCFSFGAYTFPIEGLPKFIQDVSNIFPYTHFIKYFVNRAIKGIPVNYTLHNLIALGAYFILFLSSYPLFVKKLKKGSYE
ncbi:ABC transporter permease [Ornithobacterium rhinotracheale]|uniref:ABC transporter permease n=1 Tax=Ornithobacterium rhinotracheale TaxID=28251 RepID=UPI00129C280B|nr:ABC transporter permease [Ornithobacterium rhinotracheale]MRI62613.1 ABC transporter permease [Ornithobacterium rhinotracheale]MRJ10332.1 ABC transporter permease [Ornithobacterium rhinotracheale]